MTEYEHSEAFNLMWYACDCGHTERIWNSRDGVTPFGGITCPSCAPQTGRMSGLTHVHWERDMRVVNYKPRPGQRFFRDGTKEEAVQILNFRFDTWAARGRTIPIEQQQVMIQNLHDPSCVECKGVGIDNAGQWCNHCWGENTEFTEGWPIWVRTKDQEFRIVKAGQWSRT